MPPRWAPECSQTTFFGLLVDDEDEAQGPRADEDVSGPEPLVAGVEPPVLRQRVEVVEVSPVRRRVDLQVVVEVQVFPSVPLPHHVARGRRLEDGVPLEARRPPVARPEVPPRRVFDLCLVLLGDLPPGAVDRVAVVQASRQPGRISGHYGRLPDDLVIPVILPRAQEVSVLEQVGIVPDPRPRSSRARRIVPGARGRRRRRHPRGGFVATPLDGPGIDDVAVHVEQGDVRLVQEVQQRVAAEGLLRVVDRRSYGVDGNHGSIHLLSWSLYPDRPVGSTGTATVSI